MSCYDKRVLGLAAALPVVGIVLAPSSAWTLLPVLGLLACPLCMLVMMRSLRHNNQCGRQASAAPDSGTEGKVRQLRAELDDLRGRWGVGPEEVAGHGSAL
ncbi:MAG: DUF2933 domain-containing protein [Ornithinimicrobium sp.]